MPKLTEKDPEPTCLEKIFLRPGWTFGEHQWIETSHIKALHAPWDDHTCRLCEVCEKFECEIE